MDVLKEKFPDFTFFCLAEDPEKFRGEIEKESPFQITLCIDVLYHMTDDEIWKRSLESLCRVTEPGGYNVICDYFHAQVRENPSQVHVKHRDMQEYLDLYDRHRMRAIEVIPIFYYLNRIVSGPWRDDSRIVSVLLRKAYTNSLLLKILEWKDSFLTRIVRPMSPKCKTRLLITRKE